MAELITRPLHFVLGKGGVGKSSVAAALALALGRSKRRILAIELDAPGGVSRMLGAQLDAPGVIVPTDSGVSVSYVDGAAALAEYLRHITGLGAVMERVLAHPLYEAFVQAAPGVKELMAMGKVRDELSLQKRWDAVVVDAGASGHALEYLRMPAAAAQTFTRGRVHREARRVNALLADEDSTAHHVVMTAEEMPALEAAASVRRIRELGLPLGRLVVNRCLEPAPGGVTRALELLRSMNSGVNARGEARDGVLFAAERARGYLEIQERSIARTEHELELTALLLPQLPKDSLSMSELNVLADALERRLEWGSSS